MCMCLDLSRLFVIPQGQFSQNNGNLFNTKTSSNLFLDFTNRVAYLDKLAVYGASNTGITIRSNCITAPSVLVNGLTVGVSNASVTTFLACNISGSNLTAPIVSACNIQSYVSQSNGSNQGFPLALTSTCNISLQTRASNYLRVSSSNLQLSKSNLTFIQTKSNPSNPFLPYSAVCLQLNASNAIIKNQNGSSSSTWIQDFGQVTLTMAQSNSSNASISSSLMIDSNLNVSGVKNLTVKADISTPALASSACNLVINWNAYTGGDEICSGVFRGSFIQFGGGLAINPATATQGVYGPNGKLLMDLLGQVYPSDAMNSLDLFSGCVNMSTVQSMAAYAGTYAKSVFLY